MAAPQRRAGKKGALLAVIGDEVRARARGGRPPGAGGDGGAGCGVPATACGSGQAHSARECQGARPWGAALVLSQIVGVRGGEEDERESEEVARLCVRGKRWRGQAGPCPHAQT